ncbi:unnamed protein product [Bursaphelenchus xylophilus]|uniref:(pine wood nematode) hypothetical protein n=1 Tax=Bursaphelenchus xylophilus TaxID=6326 RepID=A0A7I8XR43_BURXY|nr:unnamed protein product [Bursaphelenchus xylophilus]CAG9088766.1 unnamed protein product [Bursaphelenchus xylophilus]
MKLLRQLGPDHYFWKSLSPETEPTNFSLSDQAARRTRDFGSTWIQERAWSIRSSECKIRFRYQHPLF